MLLRTLLQTTVALDPEASVQGFLTWAVGTLVLVTASLFAALITTIRSNNKRVDDLNKEHRKELEDLNQEIRDIYRLHTDKIHEYQKAFEETTRSMVNNEFLSQKLQKLEDTFTDNMTSLQEHVLDKMEKYQIENRAMRK